jgi:hypothetical protein
VEHCRAHVVGLVCGNAAVEPVALDAQHITHFMPTLDISLNCEVLRFLAVIDHHTELQTNEHALANKLFFTTTTATLTTTSRRSTATS